ncbi:MULTISPECIES: acetyl/propionyl/methylcrotonyl-CoA carboxylase subunit alpha [Agrobacterium]|jgi:acetyl-CoA/propionyl-CoA carboxylase biotin carboxyl carrier protein|uniref:acetyl/propionyl/methylcrotonyl-CoA carboxylase subunit alpha n=1 Tax=Agrobacterium TaxID=357 RepID=UPI001FAA46B3|nr:MULTISPECIES: biotin carboxylase N-terminal domain-containing protein [Agrobacterium]MCZ7889678.1 ATP-grasp domain-containing protein [Agrobacterium salinitolerans]UNZ53973.1 ATP-grasp domain-containing protein [Agrobacterium tumefaciens]
MKKILIANRGEIAVRIARACRDAGYRSIAVASESDMQSLHARAADEVHMLKGNSPVETYLNQQAILDIAVRSRADAVHPGYGVLSENETFAAAVEAAGLVWIGPSADAIKQLGDKVKARAVARKVGAPLLPSLDNGDASVEKARKFAETHGLPVIIKAQNGGGGRGMRIVREMSELEPMMAAAEREAGLAFGRPECFVEVYAENARHVETQCLADQHGNIVVLSTRDCTLQRRQQKLVEEAPAPFLSEDQLDQLKQASVGILKEVGYSGAATCEFLVTEKGNIYFLEVNTRVQVEHPVTEEVTGVDIIREMFDIAEGKALEIKDTAIRGHSIEFRINAEDPWADFRPVPGRIKRMQLPGGPGVRLDLGYREGDTIPPYYDSLVGKLIVTGRDRKQAIERAARALGELSLEGVKTVVPLHRAIIKRPEFAADSVEAFQIYTRWIDVELPKLSEEAAAFQTAAMSVEASDEISTMVLAEETNEAPTYRVGIKAPLSGVVMEFCVEEGDRISRGDVVAIMESMKMEQSILAEEDGVVTKINVATGGFIEMGDDLMGID